MGAFSLIVVINLLNSSAMAYREHHPIGKRLGAQKTLWPYSFPVSRKKTSPKKSSEVLSQTASASSDGKSLTDIVSEQLLAEISILNQMESRDSRKRKSPGKSRSEDSVVTFKRKAMNDPEISFKIEHDPNSTGQSEVSTRPGSVRSEVSVTPDDLSVSDSGVVLNQTKVKTEHLDDEISFTSVVATKKKSAKGKVGYRKGSPKSKRNRSRAASLDARVRTMFLLEKQKNFTLPKNDVDENVEIKAENKLIKSHTTDLVNGAKFRNSKTKLSTKENLSKH